MRPPSVLPPRISIPSRWTFWDVKTEVVGPVAYEIPTSLSPVRFCRRFVVLPEEMCSSYRAYDLGSPDREEPFVPDRHEFSLERARAPDN